MQIPQFIKEVIWAFYPPRYKQLSQLPVYKSTVFMTKMLLIAFLLAGIVFLPQLFMLKASVQNQLGVFDEFKLTPRVLQNNELSVPPSRPWVKINFNSNLTLKDELLVIDKSSVQYRLFSPQSIPQQQLLEPSSYKHEAGNFFTMLILLLIPGVALLLFIRSWFKYVLIILVFATLFSFITDLTRHKMKWRQMVSIACHAISPVVLIEVVSSAISANYLLPVPSFRFLGLKFYIVTLILFAIVMVFAVLGCRIEDYREKKK